MIAIEFRDSKARVKMDGEAGIVCEEASLIVNALYVSLMQANPMAGKYFEQKTRLDDSIWELREFTPFSDADAAEQEAL